MSTKTTIFIIFIVLALAITTGCGKGTQMKLTSADNNKTIDVKTGDLVVIDLEGNPTTGYNWEAKDLDTSMLEQVGEPEFKSSDPSLVGSGGSIRLTFKALKAGTTTLNLIYHRSWEKDVAPINTYSVVVTVK